jgi:nicotinate-nucleotide pyrophosphorylase (carboxylating)
VKAILRLALREDLGHLDATSASLPDGKNGTAQILARKPGVICGLPLVREIYRKIDRRIVVTLTAREGEHVRKEAVVARVRGPVKSILTGERTALNFLTLLSGIATQTRRFVDAVKGTRAGIYDTRKTPPGLRLLAKYAVRVGGGRNHRMGLFDMVLIKDNHVAALGITGAVAGAKKRFPRLKVEVEVETFAQLREALQTAADIIMLDNMDLPRIRKAMRIAKKSGHKALIEVSGRVTLEKVRKIALTGVDRIAVGMGVTHSFEHLDLSMEMVRNSRKKSD